MKLIAKFAEFIGYVVYHGEEITEWRCPNKNCGLSVEEDYVCCPHCGQRLKFRKPQPVSMIKISIKGVIVDAD